MSLYVLEESRLRCLERMLIEKSEKIDGKREKTLLDYVELLEIVVECRKFQDQILEIKRQREKLSEQELEILIEKYRQNEDMPCRELFFSKGEE